MGLWIGLVWLMILCGEHGN